MGILEEQLIYYERLLSLQYWATKEMQHQPTKGSLREVFIKNFIAERIPDCGIGQGIICGDGIQFPQADFIKTNRTATSHSGIFEIEDCLILMEIKSTAKKSEFSKLNQISQDLKKQNSSIITGLFCYNTEVSSKNIIESFGI